jgi:hypothetical protein
MRNATKWIALTLWCVLQVVATSQGKAGTQPDVQAILSAPFTPVMTWGELPAELRASLFARMEGPGMAEPGKPFKEYDVVEDDLRNSPWRRLVFAAKSGDTYVIVYEHGGIDLSLHLVIAPFGDAKTGHTILHPPWPESLEDLRARFQSGKETFYDAQNY